MQNPYFIRQHMLISEDVKCTSGQKKFNLTIIIIILVWLQCGTAPQNRNKQTKKQASLQMNKPLTN